MGSTTIEHALKANDVEREQLLCQIDQAKARIRELCIQRQNLIMSQEIDE